MKRKGGPHCAANGRPPNSVVAGPIGARGGVISLHMRGERRVRPPPHPSPPPPPWASMGDWAFGYSDKAHTLSPPPPCFRVHVPGGFLGRVAQFLWKNLGGFSGARTHVSCREGLLPSSPPAHTHGPLSTRLPACVVLTAPPTQAPVVCLGGAASHPPTQFAYARTRTSSWRISHIPSPLSPSRPTHPPRTTP